MKHVLQSGVGKTPLARARRRGTTLIELMVVMSVMLVAVSIFYQMVVSTKRLRTVNHENAVAIEAARAMIERMRNEDFEFVYSLYNEDPTDDPGVPGSAPGYRFAVSGLEPLATSADGLIGEIQFPVQEVAAGGGGLGGVQRQGLIGGAQAITELQLREDFVDENLGMPRDLNGDSMIDDQDHAEDYLILPVRVRLEWEGVFGERTLDLYTMIGEFRRS